MTKKLCCDGPSHFQSALLDRGLISAKILKGIQYFPFREARRRQQPIYEILLAELYEDGCLVTAKYFHYLTEKETRLVEQNLINSALKYRYPKLLIKLFENVKMAEMVSKEDCKHGTVDCLKILYESLIVLAEYERDLNWLLKDVYRIFVEITETILRYRCNFGCMAIIGRMYCKYAEYLTRKEHNIPQAVEYFKKTLDLCRGELWPAEDLSETKVTLHDYCAVQLTKALIAYAKLAEEPITGMKFTQKALTALAEINCLKHAVLFGEVMLLKIQYYLDNQKYRNAMSCILFVQRHLYNIKGMDNIRLTCEVYLKKGSCYNFMQQSYQAAIKFKHCRLLATKYDLKALAGRALLRLGELYEKFPSQHHQARQYFEQAKTYFKESPSKEMHQLATYAVARIMAKEHFRQLMRTIKSSASSKCATLRLYHWKGCSMPLGREKLNTAYFVGDHDLRECDVSVSDEDDVENSPKYILMDDVHLREGSVTITDDTLIEYASHFIMSRRRPQNRAK